MITFINRTGLGLELGLGLGLDPVVPTHAPRARAQRQRLVRHDRDPVTRPRDTRPRIPRRQLRCQAPERLQRRPRLEPETSARAYRDGDFEAKPLSDFNGGRGSTPSRRRRQRARAPLAAVSGVLCEYFSAVGVDTVIKHLWRAASGVMYMFFSAVGVNTVVENLWQ